MHEFLSNAGFVSLVYDMWGVVLQSLCESDSSNSATSSLTLSNKSKFSSISPKKLHLLIAQFFKSIMNTSTQANRL